MVVIKKFFKFVLHRYFFRLILKIHSELYFLIGVLAISKDGDSHPKHAIVNYHSWFLRHLLPKDNVLDIGCGNGHLASKIEDHVNSIIGIDINQNSISTAEGRTLGPKVTFKCADATKFDFKTLSVPIAVIILSNVLEHIENRAELLRSIRNNVSWLSGRKLILIRVPSINRDWLTIYKQQIGVEYRLDKTHYIEYERQELIDEIEKSGLKIIEFNCSFGEYYVKCETND